MAIFSSNKVKEKKKQRLLVANFLQTMKKMYMVSAQFQWKQQ